MKLASSTLLFSLSLGLSIGAQTKAQSPIMSQAGDVLIQKNFDSKEEVKKEHMAFRKETKFEVNSGIFNAITPKMYYGDNPPEKSKWGTSDFARVTFSNVPQEYISSFRINFNEPTNAKMKSKGRVYFDMGHRNIRVTFSTEGCKLVLSNHLLGKESEEKERTLVENPDLKFEHNKWYDVLMEVKGDEVICQINGIKLYGKDALIKKERPTNFNIDHNGVGYKIDQITISTAADYKDNWGAVKKTL
jgi:hypothetical protein